MKRTLLLILLNLCFSLSAQTLSLNTADTAPYSSENGNGFYDVLLDEIMGNLGINLRINHYPSERSILWADQGHDDGEFARIRGMSDSFSNLTIVEEPLVNFYFVAIKNESDSFSPSSWEELDELQVGYLNGWKIFETNVGEKNNINIIHNIDSLFNMLIAERLDIILYSKLRAEQYIFEHDIKGLVILEPPLAIKPMHLYMNNKHGNLIQDINDELIRLKDSGRYDEIFETYLKRN